MKPMMRVRSEWHEIVLVCRKCQRKLDGGFGEKGKTKLAKALRQAFDAKSKGRRGTVAVVEVGCLDVCPKQAVMVLAATRPAAWTVVPKGADIAGIVDRLGLAGYRARSD